MQGYPLLSAYSRLDRAVRQIGDFKALVRKFFELKNYRVVVDDDTHPGRRFYRIELTAPIPLEWSNDIADIANNLRSPLDYAVNRVLERPGIDIDKIKTRNRSMPICRDVDILKEELKKRKIEVVCPELCLFLIDTVKPYERGNDLVCYLDTLNNSKKHRDLEEICLANVGVNAQVNARKYRRLVFDGGRRWQSPKDGAILFETDAEAEFEAEIKFGLSVALSNVKGLERQPVAAALSQMANEVDRILKEFDRTFFT